MINLRKAQDRGQTQTNWLNSSHTFSFAEYYDPNFLGFGSLQVINDDFIKAQSGFGMHRHQDMEIITYVIEGELSHKDSLGHGSQIRPGEIQRMSAGHGIQHSEYNASTSKELHLLQIWIRPHTLHLEPSYEQIKIQKILNEWILIGAEKGSAQAVRICQDIKLFVAYLQEKHSLAYAIDSKRKLWIQVTKGQILLQDQTMKEGDGAALVDEHEIQIICEKEAELLLFDMAET